MISNLARNGIGAALMAAAAIGAPAMAAPSGGDVTVSKVSYSDLDLTTEAGMDRLEARLNRAAREVCGMNDKVPGSLLPSAEARSCYTEARKSFAREVAMLADRARHAG